MATFSGNPTTSLTNVVPVIGIESVNTSQAGTSINSGTGCGTYDIDTVFGNNDVITYFAKNGSTDILGNSLKYQDITYDIESVVTISGNGVLGSTLFLTLSSNNRQAFLNVGSASSEQGTTVEVATVNVRVTDGGGLTATCSVVLRVSVI
tara:strand:- start:1781 stop:2230 length:450 start_codon:yes stop_codon:yes gene_type:complete